MRSCCINALSTPSTQVMPARPITRMLHHHVAGPNRSKTTRTKPYTATLVITPLIRAETWLGAAGWASGSHTCNGTSPALDPVPISTRMRTRPGRAAGADRISEKA